MDVNKWLAGPGERSCKYGAPMGRANCYDGGAQRLYLQRVTFIDGCYSRDGTYWGAPADLWAAFTHDMQTLCFLRAPSRKIARENFMVEFAARGHIATFRH